MKPSTKRIFAALLASLMLTFTMACNTTNETPGKGTGTAGEGSTTEATAATDTGEVETQPLTGNFTVSEKEGVASITTSAGLSYDATGYESVDPVTGIITFSGDLLFTLTTDVVETKFNRFTMTYSSDKPLEVYVKYTEREPEELFYVEAGTGDFSGVLYGFLSNKHRRDFTSIRVKPCQAGWVNFSLSALTTEAVDVPRGTCFLENDRLKLGITLHWGGTISYVEDKNCPVEGLTNLVNRHDTGRLIQQSYYGTNGENNSYEPGSSFGSTWPYNPVQGGDLYQNGGRLVDFSISENSIYIKSQPCDWGKSGSYTPFYTENWYTLEDDVIRVDNRAVDFSGYEHPHHFQELPAVYVVGYLDTLTCYNGDKPWTNGHLNVYRNLPFWSHGRQVVYYAEQNTETWFAWYSETDDFGLGCYVPNVDSIGGGRNEPYLPEKNDTENSISFAGASCILRMVSYKPFEYSYLITTGSVASIRETFTEHKDFATNPALSEDAQSWVTPIPLDELAHMDLSKEQYAPIFTYENSTGVFDTAEGALKITSKSGTVGLDIQYYLAGGSLLAEDHNTIKIEYMMPTTNARDTYRAELFYCTGSRFAYGNEIKKSASGLIADGQYHILTVDMSDCSDWEGGIERIKLCPFNFNSADDVIYIKDITLANEESLAAGRVGVSLDTFKVNGQNFFDVDGDAGAKLHAMGNVIAFESGSVHETMALRGWIGFDQAIDSFGYYIDDRTDVVYGDFKQETGADVLGAGGEHASRFEITAPIAEMAMGEHFVGFVVKLADGRVVPLHDEIIVTVVPQNVAKNKPISSTTMQPGVPFDVSAPMANDGNDATRWCARPGHDTDLIVDLEELYALSMITVSFENAMMDYTISVSEDGESYRVICEGTRTGFSTETFDRKVNLDPVTARYVKVSTVGAPGEQYFSIWELGVYGEPIH